MVSAACVLHGVRCEGREVGLACDPLVAVRHAERCTLHGYERKEGSRRLDGS